MFAKEKVSLNILKRNSNSIERNLRKRIIKIVKKKKNTNLDTYQNPERKRKRQRINIERKARVMTQMIKKAFRFHLNRIKAQKVLLNLTIQESYLDTDIETHKKTRVIFLVKAKIIREVKRES